MNNPLKLTIVSPNIMNFATHDFDWENPISGIWKNYICKSCGVKLVQANRSNEYGLLYYNFSCGEIIMKQVLE